MSTGDGGLADFAASMKNDDLNVGAIKVVGVDQQANLTSKRPKYVAVTCIGAKCPALRKGLLLRNKADYEKIFNGAACTIQVSDETCPNPPSLTMKNIAKKLLASGGAHKPVFYDFGNGEAIKLTTLYERD